MSLAFTIKAGEGKQSRSYSKRIPAVNVTRATAVWHRPHLHADVHAPNDPPPSLRGSATIQMLEPALALRSAPLQKAFKKYEGHSLTTLRDPSLFR